MLTRQSSTATNWQRCGCKRCDGVDGRGREGPGSGVFAGWAHCTAGVVAWWRVASPGRTASESAVAGWRVLVRGPGHAHTRRRTTVTGLVLPDQLVGVEAGAPSWRGRRTGRTGCGGRRCMRGRWGNVVRIGGGRRCVPVRSPSFSWVMPTSLRASRTGSPNSRVRRLLRGLRDTLDIQPYRMINLDSINISNLRDRVKR